MGARDRAKSSKGGVDMANEQNLVPLESRSKEEARKIRSQGGKASVKVRRAKKSMRELCKIVLSMPLGEGSTVDVEDIKNLRAVAGENISVEAAMILKQVQKALKGDTRAFESVRDTAGERPAQSVDVTAKADDRIDEIIEALK